MVRKERKNKPSNKEDTGIIFHHHVDEMHHRMAIAGAVIVFVVVFFAFTSVTEKSITVQSADQFMYIEHETCESCITLQPVAREAARILKVPFVVTSYNRDVPFPGYILVYQDIVYLSGFQQASDLWSSLCLQTRNTEICSKVVQ